MSRISTSRRALAPAFTACFVALALAPSLPALAHGPTKAHAHGNAKLDVVVEPQKITLQFSSPLDNLLGFERAPRTAPERQRADAAVARLRAADTLFKVDPAAQCQLARVELNSAALNLGTAQADDPKDDHADLDGEVEFSCTDATKARHIDVGLFEFKRLHRIDAQVAAPSGQFKRTLKPSARRLSLAR